MGRIKDMVLYTCEMWEEGKSIDTIIETLEGKYPGGLYNERFVVNTLITYYRDMTDEASPTDRTPVEYDYQDLIYFSAILCGRLARFDPNSKERCNEYAWKIRDLIEEVDKEVLCNA